MVSQILPFHRGRGLASLSSIIVMVAFIYILGIQTSKYDLPLVNLTTEQWNNSYFFFLKGESIKCWVCRSDGDPKCADPFDNTSFPIADCRTEKPREHLPGLEPTMCRKVRQKGKRFFAYTYSLLKINIINYSKWKLAVHSKLRLARRTWSWSR